MTKAEIINPVILTYKGKEYELDFSRDTATQLESAGFNYDDIVSKKLVMIPMIFYYAFLKNHRGIKRSLVDEIFDSLGILTDDDGNEVLSEDSESSDVSELVLELAQLYMQTASSLFIQKASDKKKEIATWRKKA